MDDVLAHGATIPSAPMAELRPVALPPAERTIGKLVAESIRFYGERFWPSLALGLAPAMLAVVIANVSRRRRARPLADAVRALLSATYVYGGMLVLERRPTSSGSSSPGSPAGSSSLRFRSSCSRYVLPGACLARCVRAADLVRSSWSSVTLRGAVSRAWRLARPTSSTDRIPLHARDRVLLTRAVLAFILRGFGDAAGVRTASSRARSSRPPLRRSFAALCRPGRPRRGGVGPAIPIFVLLSRLSQQGVQTLQGDPFRLQEVNRDVEELGAKILRRRQRSASSTSSTSSRHPTPRRSPRSQWASARAARRGVETLPALTIDESSRRLSR